jgi:hypothetical protein
MSRYGFKTAHDDYEKSLTRGAHAGSFRACEISTKETINQRDYVSRNIGGDGRGAIERRDSTVLSMIGRITAEPGSARLISR